MTRGEFACFRPVNPPDGKKKRGNCGIDGSDAGVFDHAAARGGPGMPREPGFRHVVVSVPFVVLIPPAVNYSSTLTCRLKLTTLPV